MFRISRAEAGFDAGTLDQARDRLRPEESGRYHVDEIRAEPLPSGHTSTAWGSLVRHPDGRVEAEPHPWPE